MFNRVFPCLNTDVDVDVHLGDKDVDVDVFLGDVDVQFVRCIVQVM